MQGALVAQAAVAQSSAQVAQPTAPIAAAMEYADKSPRLAPAVGNHRTVSRGTDDNRNVRSKNAVLLFLQYAWRRALRRTVADGSCIWE